MSLINFELSDVGGFVKDLRSAITGKAIDDPTAQAELLYKLELLRVNLLEGQMAVNQAEAGHKSVFVSGWRPSLGWIGSFAIGYSFIVQPLIVVVLKANQIDVDIPSIELGPLMTLITGMLGFGAMRSFDKKIGTSNGH